MKNILGKLMLFFSPFFLALCLELFVLPIDVFTFRVWEALNVRKFRSFLSGEFYPNREIVKVEEGDLAHHTPYAVKRQAVWITDRHGYRKRNTDRTRHEVVIIGDSLIAGSGLTQEEILSEVLEARLGLSVYPYAPEGVKTFLRDFRFRDHPPDVVVLGVAERFIEDLREIKNPSLRGWVSEKRATEGLGDRWKRQWKESRLVQEVGVLLGRLYKGNMFQYLRATLRRSIQSVRSGGKSVSSEHGPIFFLQGAAYRGKDSRDEVTRAADVVKGYDELFRNSGIRFIFLPIPEKESMYYERLGISKPLFLEHLTAELQARGVETVELQRAFERAFQKGVLLYRPDDTHWNENGVRIAADLLAERVSEKRGGVD
jgi:hypothetical protein